MKALLKKPAVLLLLVAGVVLGALREFVFINLNYQLDHVQRGTRWSYAHSAFQRAVAGMELPGLVRLKWVLAAAFIAVNCLLVVLLARCLAGHWGRSRIIVVIYVALGLLAFGLSRLGGSVPGMDRIALQLLHLVQYPVPMLLLLAFHSGANQRKPLPS